jgi:biopolymer transport protein ExbB/TolQ
MLDLNGVVGALVAAAVGMLVATSVWVALTVLLDKAGMLR